MVLPALPRRLLLVLGLGIILAAATREASKPVPTPAAFRVEPPARGRRGPVKLIAVGDTGDGGPGQRRVAAAMDAKCREVGGCSAVLLLGDNFYEHGVSSTADTQWLEKFELVYDRPHLDGLSFYAVLGNHDYGLTSLGSKQAQIGYTRLPVGQGPGTRLSGKWTLPAAFYDVDLGVIHLFALDTQDYSAEQRETQRLSVEQSPAPWKLVFGHHPRYTSGRHRLQTAMLGRLGLFALLDAVLCAGADVYLAGHDHHLELIDRGRHPECPDILFVVSGAGSVPRRGGAPADPRQVFYDDTREGFAYLEARQDSLQIQLVDTAGTILHERVIQRTAPQSSAVPSRSSAR